MAYLFDRRVVDYALNGLCVDLLGILQLGEDEVMLDQSDIELTRQLLRYPILHALIVLS